MSAPAPSTGGHHRGRIAAVVALVLAVVGGGVIALAVLEQESPPPLSADPGSSAPSRSPATTARQRPAAGQTGAPAEITGAAMAPSKPVSVSIPAIGVRSPLLRLGLRDDGSLQVPPHEQDSKAGWFEQSPTPGEIGPSVIVGHVDSAEHGPAVFYELTKLRAGDKVTVDRADGTTAVFRVEGTVRYPKDQFPTLEVYGNLDHAGLRLITCGGEFDFTRGSYEHNIVTYATLVHG